MTDPATEPAGPPNGTPPERAVARRIGARVVPPVTRGSMVREALEQRLADVLRRRLTVVVGDAGFGKSTLLASWSAERPVAWYGLDADDRAIRVLEHGIIEAIARRAEVQGEMAHGGLRPHTTGDRPRPSRHPPASPSRTPTPRSCST